MITTKEIYFTVQDVFSEIIGNNVSTLYPNVKYNTLDDMIYYKPIYKNSPIPSYNNGRSIIPTIDSSSDEYKLLNNVLNYIQLYLSDYSCFKIEVECHENANISDILLNKIIYNSQTSTYPNKYRLPLNEFSMRFANWIKESLEVWIPKFKIYENFDYSEFLTNPDKVITKQDITTPRVARSRSQTRKVNDTPEEVGDFTGDGYVNQIEFVDNTDNAPTGTDQFDSTTTDHDVERTLRILNECLVQVRNLYRQWMIDFRRKVLID